MSPELENMIEKNFPTVLNNFKKITKWVVSGDTPENPFKGALKEANDKFQELIATSAAQKKAIEGLTKDNDGLSKQIAELLKTVEGISASYEELDERMNNLDEPAALADAPKAKPKAKAKPKVEEVTVTELEATAADIGAGELSTSALAQVDDLLDAL